MYPIKATLQAFFTTVRCFWFYILIYLSKMSVLLFHTMSIVSTVLPYRRFRLQIIRILFSQSISCKIWKSNNIYEHRLLLLLLIHHFFHHLSMKVRKTNVSGLRLKEYIYISIQQVMVIFPDAKC